MTSNDITEHYETLHDELQHVKVNVMHAYVPKNSLIFMFSMHFPKFLFSSENPIEREGGTICRSYTNRHQGENKQ